MKILAASLVIAPFMLVGALPAAAGPSISSDTPIQLAAANDSTADRDTYARTARDHMRDWRHKLQDFGEKAKAKGQKEGDAAEKDLNAAWIKTEAESRKLQTASIEGWESAKISFEKASRELADAWNRIRPEDK